MDVLPYYVLLGVAIGFVAILILRNLRLAMQYLGMVAKVAAILGVGMIVGWLLGWWELPRVAASIIFGLRRIYEPFQQRVLEFFYGFFP